MCERESGFLSNLTKLGHQKKYGRICGSHGVPYGGPLNSLYYLEGYLNSGD